MMFARIFSKTRLLAAAFVAITIPLFAQDVSPEGPEAGKELAAELRASHPLKNSNMRGTLKISGRGQKSVFVPITCETIVTDTNWTATYLTSATATIPAEKLVIIYATNAPNQYFYARATNADAALGELKPLTGVEAGIPLAGSDFWLSDFGFEFYHWPEQVREAGKMRRGRPCYVLNSINPHPVPGGYSRVELWVDKEANQPLEARAYGTDKKLLKEFELGSVEKNQVKDMKMLNDKTGSRTTLDFDLKD